MGLNISKVQDDEEKSVMSQSEKKVSEGESKSEKKEEEKKEEEEEEKKNESEGEKKEEKKEKVIQITIEGKEGEDEEEEEEEDEEGEGEKEKIKEEEIKIDGEVKEKEEVKSDQKEKQEEKEIQNQTKESEESTENKKIDESEKIKDESKNETSEEPKEEKEEKPEEEEEKQKEEEQSKEEEKSKEEEQKEEEDLEQKEIKEEINQKPIEEEQETEKEEVKIEETIEEKKEDINVEKEDNQKPIEEVEKEEEDQKESVLENKEEFKTEPLEDKNETFDSIKEPTAPTDMFGNKESTAPELPLQGEEITTKQATAPEAIPQKVFIKQKPVGFDLSDGMLNSGVNPQAVMKEIQNMNPEVSKVMNKSNEFIQQTMTGFATNDAPGEFKAAPGTKFNEPPKGDGSPLPSNDYHPVVSDEFSSDIISHFPTAFKGKYWRSLNKQLERFDVNGESYIHDYNKRRKVNLLTKKNEPLTSFCMYSFKLVAFSKFMGYCKIGNEKCEHWFTQLAPNPPTTMNTYIYKKKGKKEYLIRRWIYDIKMPNLPSFNMHMDQEFLNVKTYDISYMEFGVDGETQEIARANEEFKDPKKIDEVTEHIAKKYYGREIKRETKIENGIESISTIEKTQDGILGTFEKKEVKNTEEVQDTTQQEESNESFF